jgi:GGDEF domain-containing protein
MTVQQEAIRMINSMPDETVGTNVINRFIANVEKISPESIKGHKVTVSLGAVMVEDRLNFSEMYACADDVMYKCKEKGGSAYEFYHMKKA